MLKITRGDPALCEASAIQLVDWYRRGVYEELDGPQSATIGAVPAR